MESLLQSRLDADRLFRYFQKAVLFDAVFLRRMASVVPPIPQYLQRYLGTTPAPLIATY